MRADTKYAKEQIRLAREAAESGQDTGAPVVWIKITKTGPVLERIRQEIGELHDLDSLETPSMTADDWEAMKLSVALATLQLDKLTFKIERAGEVMELVRSLVKLQQASIRDMKKLAKVCGVDLDALDPTNPEIS